MTELTTTGDWPGSPGIPADEPMRLSVYSDARERGGAEVTLSHLLAALPEWIHLDVIGVDDDVVGWLASQRSDATGTVLAPIESRSDIAAMRAHDAAFRRLSPDLVQFNLSMASSCQWAILVATLRRLRTLLVENSSMGTWSNTSRWLKRVNSARAAAHVAVGERTARLIEADAGLSTGSVATLYHGVPDVAQHAHNAGVGSRIVNVARHDPVKGIDVLLHAMVSLPEVHLTQIGGGPETATLQALAAELGVSDRVEFRVLPWEQRAGDLIGTFDAFVLPSRLEGLPVTIMEAMLAGVPVIASNVGSVDEEITDGDTGVLVTPEDPDALASAIAELMADGERRVAMGRAAREVALRTFTVDATLGRYLALYRTARRRGPVAGDRLT